MNDVYETSVISKSELKRESAHLQHVGEQLMALSSQQLARLPLTGSLLRALDEARNIRSHEARRRHAAYVGKLVRAADAYAIEEALNALHDPLRQQRLAHWVQRLEETPEQQTVLFNEILTFYPHADRQRLRQLMRHLVNAVQTQQEAPKLQREKRRLHQYLRELEEQAPLY